jgi:hypothetical protein
MKWYATLCKIKILAKNKNAASTRAMQRFGLSVPESTWTIITKKED